VHVMRNAALIITSLVGLLAGGCGSALPKYEWPGHDAAMEHLVERGRAVRSVAGSCTIHMQSAGAGGTSLDGAIAARNPGYLRLRAWKFSHAAFDLTMTPEGLWLMTGADAQNDAPEINFNAIAKAWFLLSGEYFQSAHEATTTTREHIVKGTNADGATVRCVINRRTLTPQLFEYLDSHDVAQASLVLERHREVDGHVWPMRMVFFSDEARIVINFRDVEINDDIPPAAFRPPSRAVRQP